MTIDAPPRRPKLVYAVAVSPEHDLEGQYERPTRVNAILSALKSASLLASRTNPEVAELDITSAEPSEIAYVHEETYIDELRKTAEETHETHGIADLDIPDELTYVSKTTYADALKAAGAALAVMDAALQGGRDAAGGPPVGFALARPPGHHAIANEAMGFCFFNNVAIAARHAQKRHDLQKVMIYDFDVHHGNGTQAAFYNDPDVLFIDQHEDGVYPQEGGKIDEVGEGKGKGTTINIPLPVGSGDEAARLAFQEVVVPAARRFKPDIILVSAGYDAHWRDPLEHLQYQSSTYHALLSGLKGLADECCGGRLVVLLEGGYNLQGLSESVVESFLAVLDRPPAHLPETKELSPEPMDAVRRTLDAVKALHNL